VRPSEVGLGYGPLLVGTAVTLVGALAVVLAIVAVALGAAWLFRKALGAAWLREKQVLALVVVVIALLALALVPTLLEISGHVISGNAAFFLGSLPLAVGIAIISPKHVYKRIAISATILGLAVTGVTVRNSAVVARYDIENVTSANAIGVFDNPWEGQIARVQRIGSTGSACWLYLGDSNGIGVFVFEESTGQVKHLRTLRLPLSSVIVEILPDQVTC
jgi:hypothetical protein